MYLTTCAAGVPLLHYTKSYRWLECEFRHLSSQILRLTNPRIFLVRYLFLLAQFIMLTCNLHDRCVVDVCAAFVPLAITLCFEELSLHRMHCEGVYQLMCLSALRVPPAETRLTVYCRLQVIPLKVGRAPPCIHNYVWFFIFKLAVLGRCLLVLNETRLAGRIIVSAFEWCIRRCWLCAFRGAEFSRS